jgi:hypothetical protein
MRRTANGLHTSETRKPARTGSVNVRKQRGAATDQQAAQAEPSGSRRRQFQGDKAEFAVLCDKGPARPCAPGQLKETGLRQASECSAVKHENGPKKRLQTSCSGAMQDWSKRALIYRIDSLCQRLNQHKSAVQTPTCTQLIAGQRRIDSDKFLKLQNGCYEPNL